MTDSSLVTSLYKNDEKNTGEYNEDYCTRKQRERQCLDTEGKITEKNRKGVESHKEEKTEKKPIVQNDEIQNDENGARFQWFEP